MSQKGKHLRPKSEKPKGHRLKIALLCIAGALAVVFVGYALWERPPAIAPGPATPRPSANVTPTVTDPDATPDPDAPMEDWIPPWLAPGPEGEPLEILSGDRKNGCYTFLLVGRDKASNSTDTIIVGRMDTKEHSIHCVSIPRDTLINIYWSNTPKKINAVYPGWENGGRSGIEGLKEHIRNLLGFDVDCYAVVSIQAVEEVVDAMGGVWYEVPDDMFYYDPTQDLDIRLNKGGQILNGQQSVWVCRYRWGYGGGDIQRIGVQQDFLRNLASQLLTIGNIPNISAVLDTIVRNVETDLSAANIAWFARQFLACSMENITFDTMPFDTGCYINGVSYVSTAVNSWLKMVNSQLSPYTTDVTAANVNILTANVDGTYMNATNGYVAGGRESMYCLTCTVKEKVATHHAPGECPYEQPEETDPPEETDAPEETPPEDTTPPEETPPEDTTPPEETTPPETGEPPAPETPVGGE